LISPRDIFNMDGLTLVLKIIGHVTGKHQKELGLLEC
jgi:hypothetical protein